MLLFASVLIYNDNLHKSVSGLVFTSDGCRSTREEVSPPVTVTSEKDRPVQVGLEMVMHRSGHWSAEDGSAALEDGTKSRPREV